MFHIKSLLQPENSWEKRGQHSKKMYALVSPALNLSVESAACFLTSSALKEIRSGTGGFLPLNSSTAEMMRSAT